MTTSAAPRPATIRPKRLVPPHPQEATPADAQAFFDRKLAFETDPADVHHDLEKGVASFVVLDVRSPAAYEACHVPSAVNLPAGRIREQTTRHLDKSKLLVTYCWGPGCNGSTKAASRLSSLGFTVREMIGGLEYWRREGYALEGTDIDNAPLAGS